MATSVKRCEIDDNFCEKYCINLLTQLYTITCAHNYEYILVGGFNPSEKYESVGSINPNIWINKKSSKPPTSL